MTRMRVWLYDGDEYKLVTAYRRGKAWVMSCNWTTSCSGCCELGDYGSGSHLYGYDEKAHCLVGGGCHECGYTGKTRMSMWVPIYDKNAQIVLNVRYRIHKMGTGRKTNSRAPRQLRNSCSS